MQQASLLAAVREEIAKDAEIQGGTESISSCGQLQFISVTSK